MFFFEKDLAFRRFGMEEWQGFLFIALQLMLSWGRLFYR